MKHSYYKYLAAALLVTSVLSANSLVRGLQSGRELERSNLLKQTAGMVLQQAADNQNRLPKLEDGKIAGVDEQLPGQIRDKFVNWIYLGGEIGTAGGADAAKLPLLFEDPAKTPGGRIVIAFADGSTTVRVTKAETAALLIRELRREAGVAAGQNTVWERLEKAAQEQSQKK